MNRRVEIQTTFREFFSDPNNRLIILSALFHLSLYREREKISRKSSDGKMAIFLMRHVVEFR
jgi:hypothetical protein